MNRTTVSGLLGFVFCAICIVNARAATITVDTISDAGTTTGNCELREAIQAAESDGAVDGCSGGSGADTIVFAPALAGQTIAYGSAMSFASGTVTIDGKGQTIVLQASGTSDALQLSGSGSSPVVTIKGLDVRATGSGNGVTLVTGSITIDNSSVQGRLGINAFGSSSTVTLNNSTIASTEISAASDIGVRTGVSTNLVVNNSTIVASVGYGINVSSSTGTCSVYSSIIVGALGINGTCTQTGGTLVKTTTATAGLNSSLTNNGGPTRTFALVSGSAIDGGDCSSSAFPNNDQRFYVNAATGTRAVGTACDVGAFEKDAVASADVSINKSLTTAGPYVNGGSVSYSIVVFNAGPAPASNVQVTDTPTHLTITNVSGGGCSALPCTIPSLSAGANATITVAATINAQGAFDNSATVTAAEYDSNSSNNTDSSGNGGTASALADVSMTKVLNTVGPYYVGKSLTYTLTVGNTGPNTATNVQVSDTPTHLTITNVSGGGCAAMPCVIGSIASGANVMITVTTTINAAGAFDNSATATAAEADPNSANNTDSIGNGGTTSAAADVSLSKVLNTAAPFYLGQSLTYTLTVHNSGPNTATGVQITDTPTHLTITNVSGGGCSALPCTIPSVAVDATALITVTATINAQGAFDNSATASAAEFDPNTGNNTDSSGNGGTTSPSADVSLTKVLNTAAPYYLGKSLTYTLTVHNAGPNTATNIQVTDTPTHLTITNVSGGGCSAMPCSIASIASGAQATITVKASINAEGAFNNSATATPTEIDPNSANNTDNSGNGGSTSAAADMAISETLTTPGLYFAGETVTFSLLVSNMGPDAASGIMVSDAPTNLTIQHVSGAGCSALPCAFSPGTLTMGSNQTITVKAKITAAGAFGNNVSVSAAQFDPVSSNNSSNVTGSVSADEIFRDGFD